MDFSELVLYNMTILRTKKHTKGGIFTMKKKMFAALMAACMTVSVFGSVVTASAADGVTLTLYGNADDLAKPYM